MTERLPRYNFFAEPLRWLDFAGQRMLFDAEGTHAHTRDLEKVARRINSQHLDCNFATLVFTLPNVGEPATVKRVL